MNLIKRKMLNVVFNAIDKFQILQLYLKLKEPIGTFNGKVTNWNHMEKNVYKLRVTGSRTKHY